jgi:hypothetical protein
VTRIAVAVAAGLIALIVLGATVGFLGDALMLWLEDEAISPAGAAGLTGVAGLVLAIVLGLCAKFALRIPRRRAALPAPGVNGVANSIAADLGALAAQQIVNTTRTHPYGTMGAALAAGLAVGAVPELRKSLMGLFKH